jgi:hypothetical protein
MTEMTERVQLLQRKLREIQHSDKVRIEHLEEMAAPTLKLEATRGNMPVITPEAIDSWRRFERAEPLNEQDLFHLKSIILGNGLRPAFDIQQDSYQELPSLWQELNDRRSIMEPLIRGIGRVDLTGHPKITYAGTAFISGERHLITNRHMAEFFTQGLGSGAQLSFKPGITPALDIKQEVGSESSVPLPRRASRIVWQL